MSTNNHATTESFVPIKAINNNLIELDNGYKVAGVKVSPRNIFIMEQDEQYGVLDGLNNLYNTIDFEFWLIVTDRPVDISVYIAELQMMYNKAQSPVIRKLINEDLTKASTFTDNVSDIEFYLLFKENKPELIDKKIRIIMSGLSSAGLASSQANNDDLRTILESFLNGGQKTEFGTVLS